MKLFTVPVLVGLLAAGPGLPSRGTGPARVQMEQVDGAVVSSWFLGQEARTSPDGRIPFGADPAAFRRDRLDGGARLVDTFTQPGRSPSSPASVSRTVLRRRGTSLVYDAAEDKDGFTGTYTFADERLAAWTCRLEGRDGATLAGRGEYDGQTLRSWCLLDRPGLAMLLSGTFQAVPEPEYRARVACMDPPPGAE